MKTLEVIEAVQLGNTAMQFWPILGPLIERAMQAGEKTISMAEVETAADDAGEDLDELRAAIADRRKRDAAGAKD